MVPTGHCRCAAFTTTTPNGRGRSAFATTRRDEALVFKVYDSSKDGRARWSAHTAFDDPTSPPSGRPRESIEICTLAFF
jgi:hypothetical protein